MVFFTRCKVLVTSVKISTKFSPCAHNGCRKLTFREEGGGVAREKTNMGKARERVKEELSRQKGSEKFRGESELEVREAGEREEKITGSFCPQIEYIHLLCIYCKRFIGISCEHCSG